MKISIITVCFNSEATIRDTIESVLAQDFPNIEYIIVDGGSTDSTLSIVNEYSKKITKVISECDDGIFDAMNKGVRASSGDIVGILNSDDFYENSHVLSDVISVFESNRGTDVVFGDLVYVNPGNLKKIVRYYSSINFKPGKVRFGWIPPHPATFVRNDVYNKCGEYNLTYKIASDYEFFVRLFYVYNLAYQRLPKILVRMRTGGVSTSGIKASIQLTQEIIRACKSNGMYTNYFIVLIKIPFKVLELFIPSRIKNTP